MSLNVIIKSRVVVSKKMVVDKKILIFIPLKLEIDTDIVNTFHGEKLHFYLQCFPRLTFDRTVLYFQIKC